MHSFYFKLAFRSILRNRIFSGINLLGLSLGIAASMYIIAFLLQESRFDSFHDEPESIYRGVIEYQFKEQVKTAAFLPALAGPDISGAVPEITDYTRISEPGIFTVKFGNTFFEIKNQSFADEHFFNFLSYKLLEGNPAGVLNQPWQIVLSKSEAAKIFGDEPAIGKPLIRSDGNLLTVSGIFDDVPVTSSLQFDALISYKTIESDKSAYLGWDGGMTFMTFFKSRPGTNPEIMNKKIQQELDKGINVKYAQAGWKILMTLQNISDIHLTTSIDWDLDGNRDKSFLVLIAIIALIILAIAIVNYLNLASALAVERSKQMGVQKLSGASGGKIILQVITEALITAFFASLLSILIIRIFSPFLNNLLHSQVHFKLFESGIILLILVTFTGIFSGIYPSLILSREKILDSFRQKQLRSRKHSFRNLLVIFQFGMAIIFIIALITINRQLNYLLNKNPGFDKENILVLHIPKEYEPTQLDYLKQEINKLTETQVCSYSSQVPGEGITLNGYLIDGKDQTDIVYVLYVDEDFLECYKIPLAEGRNFKKGNEFDRNSILVNQTFLKEQNWEDWLGKGVSRDNKREIVGIVTDFNFSPLLRKIQPLIIGRNPNLDGWNYYNLNIRLSSGNMPATISKIGNIWNNFETNIPVSYEFLEERLNNAYADIKIYKQIVFMFSLLAIFIACIGLLGLTAYMNRLRTKEIGVRKVNGATIAELLVMLMKDFVQWIVFSLVLAVPVSFYFLNNWLENFAYKTSLSWWIFAMSGILALAIALLTVSWQSWRASTRNPVEALRYE